VVEDVLSKEEVMKGRDLFWGWAEKILGMGRDDPRLLESGNWFTTLHGIIKNYGVGQSPLMWWLREHPQVQGIFREIWGLRETSSLLPSFTGLCCVRPPEGTRRHTFDPAKIWLHTDQTPNTSADRKIPTTRWGAKCVQGAVNLFRSGEDDGCFYILDGSHKFHAEFFREHAEEFSGGKMPTKDFSMMKPHHIQWFEAKGCARKAVAVKKGSMTLWDSRLVHCGKLPNAGRKHPNRWRLTAFVCMIPAVGVEKKILERREKAARTNRTTSHWPQRVRLNPAKPRYPEGTNIPYKEIPQEFSASQMELINPKRIRLR